MAEPDRPTAHLIMSLCFPRTRCPFAENSLKHLQSRERSMSSFSLFCMKKMENDLLKKLTFHLVTMWFFEKISNCIASTAGVHCNYPRSRVCPREYFVHLGRGEGEVQYRRLKSSTQTSLPVQVYSNAALLPVALDATAKMETDQPRSQSTIIG